MSTRYVTQDPRHIQPNSMKHMDIIKEKAWEQFHPKTGENGTMFVFRRVRECRWCLAGTDLPQRVHKPCPICHGTGIMPKFKGRI